jgi:hypothetical protein
VSNNAFSDMLGALEVRSIKPSKPINLPAAARYYVSVLGWPVFPLKPRGKTPMTTHGFLDATLDLAKVNKWWRDEPAANIGLPTGPHPLGIGFDVIDADGPEGVEAWNRLKHRHCPSGCSVEAFCDATGGFQVVAEAFTPGNSSVGRGPGRHVFIQASGRGNTTRVGGQPIDLRGAGGYVVGVPSVNLVGSAYAWLKAPVAPGGAR